MNNDLIIALAGNPNCGKTSLFNALTGSKQHVGNWPGVTVEKKEGKMKSGNKNITVVDLPGTYSLGAYSEDEVVARDFILKDNPDVVINVVDSTNIERNLYLTMQILETGAKVVLALNMMDEAKNKNIEIEVKKLSELLNIPVVPTIATKGIGLKELVDEAVKFGQNKEHKSYDIDYGKEIKNEVKVIENAIANSGAKLDYPSAWTAIKLIENDEYINKYIGEKGISESIRGNIQQSVESLTASLGYDPDAYIIDKRYEIIGDLVKHSVKKGKQERKETASDKIDKIVTNKWLGIPIFAIIMFLMYQVTIVLGNGILNGYVNDAFSALGSWAGDSLKSIGAPDILTSFITNGLISGVGAVLVFAPMIFLMYFLISILEDTGYMARAAYVMDKFMNSIGLHGKTAVSMIIGTGCNVAGIMSTRTLESKKDRMIAILIAPFMSCTARSTVYAVFITAFFGNKKLGFLSLGGIIIFALYVLGIVVAILVGKFLSSKVFKGEDSYFIMELPPYRIPTLKGILIHMWEKSAAYVKKCFTIILSVVVVIWVLSTFPLGVDYGSRDSLIGIIGSFVAPIFALAGFANWQAAASLLAGFAAKEAVVGTMGTIYGVEEGPKLIAAIHSAFTPLSALSFMVMTLLYVPCVATIAAIRRETNSGKIATYAVIYTCVIAWVAAVIVYQLGRLMGFN